MDIVSKFYKKGLESLAPTSEPPETLDIFVLIPAPIVSLEFAQNLVDAVDLTVPPDIDLPTPGSDHLKNGDTSIYFWQIPMTYINPIVDKIVNIFVSKGYKSKLDREGNHVGIVPTYEPIQSN